MKSLSSKKVMRIEKKKKKMEALVEISKLNEIDRNIKNKTDISETALPNSENTECEPHPKRLKVNSKIRSTSKDSTGDEEQTEDKKIGNCNTFSGKPLVSGEEYMKLKKQLRERKAKLKCIPKFRLKPMGDAASLSVELDQRIPLFLSDIQHLLMYSLLGHHSPYSPQRWCQLEKYNRISQTVVIVVDNLSSYHYLSYETMFSNISKTFIDKVEVVTPASYKGDIVQELAVVPLTNTNKDKLIKQFGSLYAATRSSKDVFRILRAVFPVQERKISETFDLPVGDKFSRTQLLLCAEQLVEENYPLPLSGQLRHKYSGYTLTKEVYLEVGSFSPMFGLDCEMCRTTSGFLELTRVSVVNEKQELIYDKLVKPHNKITDYLTKYSGITPEIMKNVTTNLEEVQNELRQLLPADAILVGQSLNFDLHALQMMHPYIIDTSVIFNITGDRNRKSKLQILAQRFLAANIQQGNKGHSPIEDSLTSLRLVQLKLANSIEFGDAVLSGRDASLQTYTNIGHKEYGTSLFNHFNKVEKTAAIIGCENNMQRYSQFVNSDDSSILKKISCFTEDSSKSVIGKACEMALQYSFVLAHIGVEIKSIQHENSGEMFKKIDKWVKKLWTHVATNGLCVVVFAGHSEGGNGTCFVQIKKE